MLLLSDSIVFVSIWLLLACLPIAALIWKLLARHYFDTSSLGQGLEMESAFGFTSF